MTRDGVHAETTPGLVCARSFLAALVLVAGARIGAAQDTSIDVAALFADLQLQSPLADSAATVLWLPEQFFAADPGMSPADRAAFTTLFSPYLVVGVADGQIGRFGGVTYVDEGTIRAITHIVDEQGTEYAPLDASEVSPDLLTFIVAVRPMLESNVGLLGRNMHFVVFPGDDASGRRIADATGTGRLIVQVGDERFTWRLPLPSLVPAKVCPVDGERLNGTWVYCPWHGAELESPAP